MSITSKLIDGTFPDYRRIIRRRPRTATVERKALADAVGRCMPLCQAAKTHAPIDLVHDIAGELVVRVNAADGAEIEDRIGIEGAQFAVSLSGHLLAATLASFVGNTIEIGLLPGSATTSASASPATSTDWRSSCRCTAPSGIGLARRRTTWKRRWDDEGGSKNGMLHRHDRKLLAPERLAV